MDPTKALQELRDAIREYDESGYRDDVETEASASASVIGQIIEKFEALDEWLCRGGFPPNVWDRSLMGRTHTSFYNVSASVTYNTGTGWSASRTGPTVVIDSGIQGALTPDAAIDVFIDLIKSTHAIDDSDLELSVVATNRETDAVATRELRLTF